MKITLYLAAILLYFNYFDSKPFKASTFQDIKTLSKSIADGKDIYMDFCIQCHLGNGKGSRTVPPLAGSDWLIDKRQESIHIIKFGRKSAIVVNGKEYNRNMSAMGLNDEEVADVMNYIMNSWENKQKKQVTTAEVTAVKK